MVKVHTMETKLQHWCLEWLGHLSRMPDYHFPKRYLFGWLSYSRPFCGPRRQWRDLAKGDLKNLGTSDGCWYQQAQERDEWRFVCDQSSVVDMPNQLATNVVCHVCGRRNCDKAWHRCTVERSKEQVGDVQCDRWFRSQGGMAVHRCREVESTTNGPAVNQFLLVGGVCGRQFRRSGDSIINAVILSLMKYNVQLVNVGLRTLEALPYTIEWNTRCKIIVFVPPETWPTWVVFNRTG